MTSQMIPPGSTIGILGGGQLGRMTAAAAAQLGYRTIILAPETEAPAAQLANHWIQADYTDHAALDQLAQNADLVTLEFENVPVSCLEYLQTKRPVRPGPSVLRLAQDRLDEKTALNKWNIATADFAAVNSPDDFAQATTIANAGAILKTRRFGYDGKGQIKISAADQLPAAFKSLGSKPAILEALVDFKAELSIIIARSPAGATRCFPAAENRHANHILRETIVPMALPANLAADSQNIAQTIAQQTQLEGLIAVEMFLTQTNQLLVNELAPRPHNSGHWSIEGAPTSQFEQLIRATCNLPLGDTTPLAPCRMTNILGNECNDWPKILAEPGAHLHLYGKSAAKPGRKMGHITKLSIPATQR